VSHLPSISLGGRIVEVGRTVDGKNEIILEVAKGQTVTVCGVSDTFAKFIAQNLYKDAMVTMEVHT
jgi:hypothetical protein